MIKVAAKKVVWMARATTVVVGLAIMLALVLGLASAAFGANGQNFFLGQLNNASAITKLISEVSGGPTLQVANNNTAAGSRALQLNVADNKPPLAVNANAGKATNLNAGKLDGQDASAFLGIAQKATNSDKLDGKDSSEFGPSEFYHHKEEFLVSSGAEGVFSADCDSGDVAMSGGYRIIRKESLILQNRPSEFSQRSWLVHLRTGALSESLEVHVHCADFPPLRP